jgi:cell division protein FtsB
MGGRIVRVQLEWIDLIGGGRRVEFEPGLNVITGPISTGKTTFIGLCRSLLSSSLQVHDFTREARENVTAVGGEVYLGGKRFSIVRPLVSTDTAKVDIAGPNDALRLPASRPDRTSDMTYGQWLLRTLQLPELRVPSAPSRQESEPTPVTISDYFLYCRLTQDEIDSSVFAHSDTFKNIKRRYVFEIIYGLYDPSVAFLQEELRNVLAAMRHLNVQTDAFQRFLEDTPWANRAELMRELEQARRDLDVIEAQSISQAASAVRSAPLQDLQHRLRELELLREQRLRDLERSKGAVEGLDRLMRQLDSQIGKLTRSIVADSFLGSLEFMRCPRCSTEVDVNRATSDTCGLCLQTPKGRPLTRPTLIAEQDRLGSQLQETRELILAREEAVGRIEREVSTLDEQRANVSRELNYLSQSFISDRASEIAGLAAERASTKTRVEQLNDYLGLFSRLDRALGDLADLDERRLELEARLDVVSARTETAEQRIERLESEFATLVERLRLPRLEGPDEVRIDRRTYLPVIYGRRFSELSSQGLQVLVNVAHALAHHRTSIALNLGLPQILFIDGLTSNLGHEGEDLLRVNAVYDYLIELSGELGDQFQIIVADNDVPPQAESFVRLRLEENERLIRPNLS